MTSCQNRFVSAALSIAGTVALVAFASPGVTPHTPEFAAAKAPAGVTRAAG